MAIKINFYGSWSRVKANKQRRVAETKRLKKQEHQAGQ